MSKPEIRFTSESAFQTDADVIVIGARKVRGEYLLYSTGDYADIAASLSVLNGFPHQDQLTRLPLAGAPDKSVAVIGLGSGAITDELLRNAAGAAVRQLTGVTKVAFDLPLTTESAVAAVAEGAALGTYSYTAYRSHSLKDSRAPVAEIAIHSGVHLEDPEALITRTSVLKDAVALTRDLGNTPPADLFPASFAEFVENSVADLPVEVTIWDETALERDGFGGLLSVGLGSTRGPRLVKISYSPEDADSHIALVGKGITFDTGGNSMKDPVPMVGMKYDMAGAAAAFGAVYAAARLELGTAVTSWLCLAENMVSGSSSRPQDILTIRGGKTVEVLNTDAEGRLVLADGLVAAGEEKPDAIINIATLTGAQVIALGKRYTALMGDDELVAEIQHSAAVAGEKMWPMPLPEELRAMLNSEFADIANVKLGSSVAGMLTAGVFLKEFATPINDEADATIPWAHLDISGPADNHEAPYGIFGAGATGVSVRTLVTLVEGRAKS